MPTITSRRKAVVAPSLNQNKNKDKGSTTDVKKTGADAKKTGPPSAAAAAEANESSSSK
jgi:hypothetical protein